MRKFFLCPRKAIMLAGLILLIIFFVNVFKLPLIDAETEDKQSPSGKLLVLPFNNMTKIYGKNENVRCPICGKVFITGDVPDTATDYLSEKLISLLKQAKYYKKMAISSTQYGGADLMANNIKNLSERQLLLAAGRSAKADKIIVGYIYRFRQRIGSRLSVDSPASVAFGVHILDVKTGRNLWRGRFDETQRSLSENLFNIDMFIKRKASWITAEEMAHSALKEMLQTLPAK
jgi:hypothetical protein